MAPVDHLKPPARAVRRHGGHSTHSTPPPTPRPQRPAPGQPRSTARKTKRSHSAIGAAVVAIAAVVAVVAFILTKGSSHDPAADGLRMGSGTDSGAAAPPTPSNGGPTTTKADRNPPSAKATPKTTEPKVSTPPPVDTGPESPKFKRGQWIVVLEKYTTDVGMDSEQSAKDTAVALSRAGIPAKAMLVDGQYPGVVNSSWEPVTNSWFVYLGPGRSAEQMQNLCLDPRTQAIHGNPSCPTYEPAANPDN